MNIKELIETNNIIGINKLVRLIVPKLLKNTVNDTIDSIYNDAQYNAKKNKINPHDLIDTLMKISMDDILYKNITSCIETTLDEIREIDYEELIDDDLIKHYELLKDIQY